MTLGQLYLMCVCIVASTYFIDCQKFSKIWDQSHTQAALGIGISVVFAPVIIAMNIVGMLAGITICLIRKFK